MNKLNKHASHIIIIEDHSFKANDSGMWNLTEIWKVLELTRAKAPSQWRTKSAVRLEALQKCIGTTVNISTQINKQP